MRRVFNKLYPRGYVDWVLGRARTEIAPPVNGGGGFGSGVLSPGEYRVGMRWCPEKKMYVQTASVSTYMLCRGE